MSKMEDRLEVIVQMLVPGGNGRVGDARNRKVLKDISNEEINALMSSGNR